MKTLSLAQQQLIEIAKCVYTNPKVLFLDEPSSSLSKAEETILYDLVRNLKQKGIAIVLITHKMEEVFQLCDTLSILRDGKCVAEGRVDDFKLEDITAHMPVSYTHLKCVSYLKEKNIEIVANYVGELLTVQEQAGFQMFMARMDDELLHYWNAPCNTPYMKK